MIYHLGAWQWRQISFSCALLTASLWERGPRGVLGSGADSQTFPIADYVFVTPVEVDSGGSYISHDILHNGRKKRSAQSASSSLHYRFSAFGQELHLELKPSAILSSHFIVQVLGKDGASTHIEELYVHLTSTHSTNGDAEGRRQRETFTSHPPSAAGTPC